MRKADRSRALAEVEGRVVSELAGERRPIEEILAETIYLERRRLREEPDDDRRAADQAFLHGLEADLRGASDGRRTELLRRAVSRYAEEIVGTFDDRVYQAVTRLLPPALGVLLNAASPKRLVRSFPSFPGVDQALVIEGELQHLRRLHDNGTVILVPTHVSNLDSILVGYALYRLGLPPFLYGAGLNLFTNPMIGFFMSHLGAYTVDRKKQDPLYKRVLKEYATVTLELGYDNIFFPGGTRSRSGAIERRLKLGLLGAGIHAYAHNLRRRAPSPRIFIVPVTLSYELVLEAGTLIDDFLKEVGKARYIITDDEFSQPSLVFEFVAKLLSLDSKIYFRVGRGFDPFGNDVDDDGESLDPMGRRVDPSRYLLHRGEIALLRERDEEYTREVGERVLDAFTRDNVAQATHATARAVFSLVRQRARHDDLLRTIRTGSHDDFAMVDVLAELERLLARMRALEAKGHLRLEGVLRTGSAEDVLADGLRHFALYHSAPAAHRKGDRVIARDRALLFYYQNRLEGFGLPPEPTLSPCLSADHRSLSTRGAP